MLGFLSVCVLSFVEAANDDRYEEGNERESHDNYWSVDKSDNPAFNVAINKGILYQEALIYNTDHMNRHNLTNIPYSWLRFEVAD